MRLLSRILAGFVIGALLFAHFVPLDTPATIRTTRKSHISYLASEIAAGDTHTGEQEQAVPSWWFTSRGSAEPRPRLAIMTWYAGPGDGNVFRAAHGAPLHYELLADTDNSGADPLRRVARGAANFSAAVVANACAIRALSPPDVDALVLVLPTTSDAVVRAIKRTGARVVRAEIMPMLDARRQYGLRANDTSFRIRAIDFSKLWAFLMVDYDRLLFLDADALLMRDVSDALLRNASYSLPNDEHIGAYYRPFTPQDGKMEWVEKNLTRFQAGVMLLRPSARTFGELFLRFWRGNFEPEPISRSIGVLGDQSLIAAHFPADRRLRLPETFNCRHCPWQSPTAPFPHVLHARDWMMNEGHDDILSKPLLRLAEQGQCSSLGRAGSTVYSLLAARRLRVSQSPPQLAPSPPSSLLESVLVNQCNAALGRIGAPFSNRSDGRRKWFFDLGANHGQSVRYFRSKVTDPNDWNVWSFDCNPKLFPLICKEMHGLTHAGMVDACVSNATTRATFYIDVSNDVSSSLLASKMKGPAYQEKWSQRDVQIVRFRDVLHALVRPDDFCFVKFDVEGAEYAIIPDLLTDDSDLRLIDIMALEWHARFYPNGAAVEAQMRARLTPYDIPRMDEWDGNHMLGWNETAFAIARHRSGLF